MFSNNFEITLSPAVLRCKFRSSRRAGSPDICIARMSYENVRYSSFLQLSFRQLIIPLLQGRYAAEKPHVLSRNAGGRVHIAREVPSKLGDRIVGLHKATS